MAWRRQRGRRGADFLRDRALAAFRKDRIQTRAAGKLGLAAQILVWVDIWTPTLAAVAAALPPEGAHSRLGAARRHSWTPTLAAVAAALPPEGAHSRLGAALRRSWTPTLSAPWRPYSALRCCAPRS